MSETENGGASGSFGSSAYIWGEQVANAETYTLYEKAADGNYTAVGENGTELYFDLTALDLSEGDHTFVVQASADGYPPSAYSNEVVYTVAAVASGSRLLTFEGKAIVTADGNYIILKEN